MRVGILYDLYEDYPWLEGEPPDAAAENEPIETVETIEDALRIAGHEPVRVGGAKDLMARLGDPGFDVAVNIAEGARSRNREGQVPTLLELIDIPFAGSDAPTLSLSLDKVWTKDLAHAAGVRAPAHAVYGCESDVDEADLPAPFPLFVKPRYEGSAKGLTAQSRVEDMASLRREVRRMIEIYRQDALVEAFVDGGGEFTVAIAGDPPEALPVIQRAVERKTRIGLHVLEREDLPALEWDLPGDLTDDLETRLQQDALAVFRKLECRDFARVDFRVDADGNPWFLEINPLPTFRPGDTFAISAELAGRAYPEFLAELLGGAVERALKRKAGTRTAKVPTEISRPGSPAAAEWADWRWHMRNRIRTVEALREWIDVTPDEEQAIRETEGVFQWSVTPHYASLMDPDDAACPIRRQVVPLPEELAPDIVGVEDPLEEVAHSPVKNLIHNYDDRVAFCVTSQCAIYCRYCLRKRMVGEADFMMRKSELRDAISYIAAHDEIRDVLLTGGDPLTLGDRNLDWLLGELGAIDHVEIVRIGSRMPVKLPQRITPDLCAVLERHAPVWMNTHFNHPREITTEAAAAIDRLLKAGVPVGNQTVLLAGINDTPETMLSLCRELVRIRIRPYYLYQAQVIGGTAHMRTPIETGLDIMHRLQGIMTGFAIPKYVLDTPFGKIPLTRDYILGRSGDAVVMRSTRGELWAEPNPTPSRAALDGLRTEARLDDIEMPPGTSTIGHPAGGMRSAREG